MAAGMNMSLGDIMKRSRTTPYPIPHARKHSMIPLVMDDDVVARTESGTKLYISNLDHGVSNDDIELLFLEEGELKRYCIHYDLSGRSKGTAEVVFVRHSDALAAIKKYNNIRLDGKPLQIELVGTSSVTPPVEHLFHNNLLGRTNGIHLSKGVVRGSGLQNDFPSDSGGEMNHIRKLSFRDFDHALEKRGHAKVKGNIRKVTGKDLEDDLERYHLEAKRIKKQIKKKKQNGK